MPVVSGRRESSLGLGSTCKTLGWPSRLQRQSLDSSDAEVLARLAQLGFSKGSLGRTRVRKLVGDLS